MAVNLHTTKYRFGINELAESTHGWHANENANPAKGVIGNGVTFLLRFTVQETGGTAAGNTDQQFQYNKNAAGWNNITTSSAVVKAVATSVFANAADLTKRLSGTGTFESSGDGGTHDGLSGGIQNDIAASGNSETECALQIVAANVADGDSIQFRLTSPDFAVTNDVVPTLTVAVPVTGTLATTNAADASAASGTIAVLGSAATSNAADTSSASGTITVSGTAAATNEADASSASGTVSAGGVTGTAATTNADDASAASGAVASIGSSEGVNAADTSSASGTVASLGSSATTNAADASAAAGAVASIGSAATVNAADTSSASGTIASLGSSATANAADASAVAGEIASVGNSAAVNAADASAASGAVSGGAITGTSAATNAADTSHASGEVSGGEQLPAPDYAWRLLTGEYPKPRRREPDPPLPAPLPPLQIPAPAQPSARVVALPGLRVVVDPDSPIRDLIIGEMMLPEMDEDRRRRAEEEQIALALLLAA